MNSRRKFRVAMIHYGTGRSEGGAENTVKAVSRELVKRGHEVYIITNFGKVRMPDGVNVIRVPYVRIPLFRKLDYLSMMVTFSLFAFCVALVKRCNVIHVQFYIDGFFPIVLAKLFGIRTVYTANGMLLEELKVASLADAIGVYCRYLKEHYDSLGIRCYEAFVGIDENLMKPDRKAGEKMRKRLGIGKDDFVVTVVARPAGLKAPETLYDIVRKTDENIHFILVGIGAWVKFQEMRKHRKNLHTFGIVAHDELASFYRAADISMHMETVPGICITILESIACGTPVISATPAGGAHEIVSSEVGYKMPLDAEKIAALIRSLSSKKRVLRAMCKDGSVFLGKKGYLWSITAQRYEKIYQDITGNR